MGARSAEALARRAAKRGRTIEEERAAERKKEKDKEKKKEERPKANQEERPPAQEEGGGEDGERASKKARTIGIDVWKAHGLEAVQKAGKLKRDEKAGWVCTAQPVAGGPRCGFINFANRATCRQCNTLRYNAPEKAIKHEVEKQVSAKTRRQEKVTDPSRAWAGTADVSTEKLEENKRLREKLASDPDSLSAEERQRAEILVERDARKRAKKEEIKKAKGVMFERQAASKAGFRDQRREQVAASKGVPPKAQA